MCRVLFEHTSDGIFVATSQGDILEVNQQLCDQLCYTRNEMLSLSRIVSAMKEFAIRVAIHLQRSI